MVAAPPDAVKRGVPPPGRYREKQAALFRRGSRRRAGSRSLSVVSFRRLQGAAAFLRMLNISSRYFQYGSAAGKIFSQGL